MDLYLIQQAESEPSWDIDVSETTFAHEVRSKPFFYPDTILPVCKFPSDFFHRAASLIKYRCQHEVR